MTKNKRKICVVSGARAEYGILYRLMKEIKDDPELELQLIVTGMNLSPEFGLTYREIEKDGFKIDEKVEMLLSSDTPVGITQSMGLATIVFAGALERLKPDILVLHGDRYEMLAAAQAAMVARIPIAHLSCGDTTEGMIDEAIRHSITKMAHLHFAYTEQSLKRVRQLGEDKGHVFNFGAPSLDGLGDDDIDKLELLDREKIEERIGFKFGKKNFLVTYHPVTLSCEGPEKAVKALLQALDAFPEAKIIFTKQNADTSGRIIGQMIDKYAAEQKDRVYVSVSLGQKLYLSVMKCVDVVIGNSSSGLLEAPMLEKPTVNIGDRQKGRLGAKSVIDCKEVFESIVTGIKKALSPEFKNSIAGVKSSYYAGGKASVKIKDKLKDVNLEGILKKKFRDLDFKEKVMHDE